MPDSSTSNTNAIELKDVSIYYKLYNKPKDRLKEALHPFKRKYHRQFYAVKSLSLEVPKGEILGIVGRNGAGKSTLLKLICGVLQPTNGTAVTNGKISALLEISSGLNPEFTGLENVYFAGSIMGFTKKEMDERLDGILAFADIGDFVNQPLKIYSSGMKARLGFAVAINIDPEILILDEVLSVGDELFQRKCYAKMEQLFESDCTVLFVSHSVNNINQICSRAILLDEGELILDGHPKLVTMHYEKHLFAGPGNAARIRNEIVELNRSERKKKGFAEKVQKKGKPNEIKGAKETKSEIDGQSPNQSAFYIPDLKPKTTVVTKNYDVDIYEFCIETPGGEKVNSLITNEEYVLAFKARFDLDLDNVAFGVRFRTIKGLSLLTARLNPNDDPIKDVRGGDEFSVCCKFRCNLMQGTYFIDLGIVRFEYGERVLLAQISDALIFRVQELDDNHKHVGLVFLDHKTDIIKNHHVGSEATQ